MLSYTRFCARKWPCRIPQANLGYHAYVKNPQSTRNHVGESSLMTPSADIGPNQSSFTENCYATLMFPNLAFNCNRRQAM
jgi:hypothetical protein